MELASVIANLRTLLSQASPGDWHSCEARDGYCHCQSIFGTKGESIARVYGSDSFGIEGVTVACPDLAEGRANRRLISAMKNALPMLLDAIESKEKDHE